MPKALRRSKSFVAISPVLLAFVLFFTQPLPAAATGIETAAREVLLVDAATGQILLSKAAEERMPPASMSKLMTLYMVFEKLQEGTLSLDDELLVSEKAWRKGGSKMFVELGNRIKVIDLLQGVVVQSGNDACIVLAEGLSGSEEAFAEAMNRKARELGLRGSNFTNSTGWPDPDHYMTAYDLALLSKILIERFPEYYSYFAQKEFTWHEITQQNRNPLLYRSEDLGVDGLKTGHTEEAGYGLTASAKQGDRRLIIVVNGLSSMRERSEEVERLLRWGFREFENYQLFAKGEPVGEAELWKGSVAKVALVSPVDIVATLPRANRDSMEVSIRYSGPIRAPVSREQPIAELVIDVMEGGEPYSFPLYAAHDVGQASFLGRIWANGRSLLAGLF